MEEEKKRVQYTDPDGHVQDGWAIDGHVYQDEAGTMPMPVGSTYTTPDGKTYTQTATGGQYVGQHTQPAPYYQQMEQVMSKIENNEPFSFDLDGDTLYQQYKNQYEREGQLAMKDTYGQAAALTGGYGSTYAETSAQQAYEQYLDKLNDKVPELYDKARDAYDAGQDALYEKWKLLSTLYSQEQDAQSTQAKSAYELALLTLKSGAMPNDDLLNRAGIDPETARTLQKYYAALLAAEQPGVYGSIYGGGTGSGSGGGSGGGSGSGGSGSGGSGSGYGGAGYSEGALELIKTNLRSAAEAGNYLLVKQILAEAMQTATKKQMEILQAIVNTYAMQD